MKFSPAAVASLGWYVYLLEDPSTGIPFYVGKGVGQRAFAHSAEARDRADHPELQTRKHEKILQIREAGSEVRVEILRHHLRDEHEAYEVESAAIDLIGHLHRGSLLNLVSGHHSQAFGLLPASEIEIRYAAPLMPNPGVPVVFVSLNSSWHPGMTGQELEEWTARWWRATQVPPYVIGVHRTIARSVFRIVGITNRKEGDRDWQADIGKRPRHGYLVEPAPEMQDLIGTSVEGLLGNQNQWSFRYIKPADFAKRDDALRPPVGFRNDVPSAPGENS